MSAADFISAVDAFAREVTDMPASAAARAADVVRDEVAARTPVRSGRLQAGWSVDPAAGPVVRVINAVPYAAFVEYGTRGRPGAAMARGAVVAVAARIGEAVR